ncbi:MAG: ABC transporter permease [Chloroflexi bacterium]|nr:ABC transporter permease [Chloroflexota bacterium]
MSLARATVIARANLVRLVRDRLGLFFICVLPLIIVTVIGLQFGGGFQPRVGLFAPDGGPMAGELGESLGRDWQVERYEDSATMAADVESGRLAFAVSLPSGYTERVRQGETVEVGFASAAGDAAIARRSVVAGAIADQASLARAALFAASEAKTSVGVTLPLAESMSDGVDPVRVNVATLGGSIFPASLTGFALGAQGQLVLFIFLTSLTGSAQLILSRTLGVSRRMLSTSTPMPAILLGEALGRFGVALFQAVIIVAATALVFGVTWGDPAGIAALVLSFSAVCAAIAMLIGATSTNAEQAGSIGVFAGLGIAALGGAMIPPEIFPPIMDTISWLTPHRWAIDGFRALLDGGTLITILPQVGILVVAAVMLLALATWRLRLSLTS